MSLDILPDNVLGEARVNVLADLTKAGNMRAKSTIFALALDPYAFTRLHVGRSLGAIIPYVDDPQCMAVLRMLASDKHDRVREEAEETLVKLT